MKENKELTEMQRHVLLQKGTEPAYSGEYLNHKRDGMYHCARCGEVLFSSSAKFDSGTGWPSFDRPDVKDTVLLKEDNSHGMSRTEVICKKCGGHLGHVCQDGPSDTTGERYCINSCALEFNKLEE